MTYPLRDRKEPIPSGNVDGRHLGDGAYASRDSHQVWVSADRDDDFHAVALDGEAIRALYYYARRIGLIRD